MAKPLKLLFFVVCFVLIGALCAPTALAESNLVSTALGYYQPINGAVTGFYRLTTGNATNGIAGQHVNLDSDIYFGSNVRLPASQLTTNRFVQLTFVLVVASTVNEIPPQYRNSVFGTTNLVFASTTDYSFFSSTNGLVFVPDDFVQSSTSFSATMSCTFDTSYFTDNDNRYLTGQYYNFNWLQLLNRDLVLHWIINSDVLLYSSVSWSDTSDAVGVDRETLQAIEDLTQSVINGTVALENALIDVDDSINRSIEENKKHADQAHEDAEAIKDSIDTMLDKEKEEAENSADVDDGDMQDAFDLSDQENVLRTLADSLTYTGTDFSIKFPSSGNLPIIGNLWSEQEIPLKYWIDSLPPVFLIIIRFFVSFGGVGLTVFIVRRIIRIFNNGG